MSAHGPRRIAVVPAYNEEPTVAAVLEELYPLVDELVVVDDGSTDATRAEIEGFIARGRPNCHLLVHETNQGMSEAYATALARLRERLARHELDADDLVFTVDADGQHDLHVLDELVEMTRREGLDANLARQLIREIKDSKLKVQVSIQGDEVRVAGKKRDDLQAAIAVIRGLKIDQPLQYLNFRE